MKKPMVVAAFAVSFMAGIALASDTARRPAATLPPHPRAILIPPSAVTTIVNRVEKPRQNELPPPGLYAAEPYSLLVMVPKPVDGAFIVGPGTNAPIDAGMIRPPLRLVPVK